MKPIKTPKGLEHYTPGDMYGSLKSLRAVHPDIKLYLSATRKEDGVKFKAGQWAKLKSGEEIFIVAFDKYKFPLPINEKDKPMARFNSGGILHAFYKAKYKHMTRAIYYSVGMFVFWDINEYKGIKR